MYNEQENKSLTKATMCLLKKSITDIRLDKTNLTNTLLKLHKYVDIVFNDNDRCKELNVLILSNLWSMFNKEVRK